MTKAMVVGIKQFKTIKLTQKAITFAIIIVFDVKRYAVHNAKIGP